ncbi:hypothetical protein WICPIJ_007274 [Wickerhamomyces pijperi]|uniref:Uncharacterized protein n=1 Tax=Wickerhamomyces pijperi TaxID=599730 RepID=A0A9P8TKK7_WICPI|nr:hypothetical protein WICPIJ_007274 [Wickerhamomyces pijperi]
MEPFHLKEEFTPPLRNYKDPNLASKKPKKGDRSQLQCSEAPKFEIDDFQRSILYKLNDIIKNPLDTSFLTILSKFMRGENNAAVCSKFLKGIDLKAPQNIKEISSFVFNPENDRWTWMFDPQYLEKKIDDISYKVPKNSKKANNKNESDCFANVINRLVLEEERVGAAIKVFFCSKCLSGTSYAAEKVKRNQGLWCCNLCKTINTASENDFFIYNRIEMGLVFIMKQLPVWERVEYLHKETLKNYKKKAKSSIKEFSPSLLDKDQNLTEIRTLSNAPFTMFCCSRQVPITDMKTKKIVYSDEKLHELPSINVILSLEEVPSVTPTGDSAYILSLRLAGFTEEERGILQVSHRLMCIPKINDESGDFKLDEILSVVYENINHLSTEGIEITNPITRQTMTFRLNLVNFCCTPDLVKVILKNTSPEKTRLAHPYMPTEILITDFNMLNSLVATEILPNILTKLTNSEVKALRKLIKDGISPDGKCACGHCNDGDNFLEKKYTLNSGKTVLLTQDLMFNLMCPSEANFRNIKAYTANQKSVVANQLATFCERSRGKYGEFIPVLSSLYTACEGMIYMNSHNTTVRGLKTLKQKCKEFVGHYKSFIKAYPKVDPSYIRLFENYADWYYYYGPFEVMVTLQNDTTPEMDLIKQVLNTEHSKIFQSINKSNVILYNYHNAMSISFKQFNCTHNHTAIDVMNNVIKTENKSTWESNTIAELRKGKNSSYALENEKCVKAHMESSGKTKAEVLKLSQFKNKSLPISLLNGSDDESVNIGTQEVTDAADVLRALGVEGENMLMNMIRGMGIGDGTMQETILREVLSRTGMGGRSIYE